MSQCINPYCQQHNPDDLEICQGCGSSLILGGRFRATRLLREAQGKQSDVFEAIDIVSGSAKILKVLPELRTPKKLIELFQRESQALEQLHHPKIPAVDFYGSFQVRLPSPNENTNLYCLAMEKIEGVTLSTWLTQGHKLTSSLAMEWYRQLLEVLNFVHTNDYIHRDIKPSNIILRENGELVLIDFGSCRKISSLTYLLKVSTREEDGRLPGETDVTALISAGYTPYEQVRGKAVIQSDFFALGRTFVHLMSGQHPTNLEQTGTVDRISWHSMANHIAKPLLIFTDELIVSSPVKRPRSSQEIIDKLEHIPKQIKIQRLKSSWYSRLLFTLLTGLCIYGGYKIYSNIKSNSYLLVGNKSLFEKADYQKAKYNYNLALHYNPSNIEALNNLALSCAELREDDCAIDQYKKSISIKPIWNTYFNLGGFYQDRKDYNLAKEYYQTAIKVSQSNEPDPFNNLAYLEILNQDYPKAITLIQKGLSVAQEPKIKAVLLKNRGWVELSQRQYEKAEATLLDSTRLDAKRVDTFCLLAQTAESLKKSAEQWWEACLQFNSPDASSPEVQKWRSQILKRALIHSRNP